MEFEIVHRDGFKVCGSQIELTKSQSKNYEIIREHWQRFNNELYTKRAKQGKNWVKYGITRKIAEQCFYLTAIPAGRENLDFEIFEIKGGEFALFCHKGKLELFKSTIYNIYKCVIPNSGFKIDVTRSFLHYEYYDYRFHWNNRNSIIDIYIPIIV